VPGSGVFSETRRLILNKHNPCRYAPYSRPALLPAASLDGAFGQALYAVENITLKFYNE
jgi:hypothetical protein